MLEFRHYTFLILCQMKSYTKTAEALFITQPAVSQQIGILEETYGQRLIAEKGRNFSLTPPGEQLYSFLTTLAVDMASFRREFSTDKEEKKPICIGATKTIGEFVLPNLVSAALLAHPQYHISLMVDNTKALLRKLEEGTIDFAFLEGYFPKDKYSHLTFSHEKFIGICGPQNDLLAKEVSFEALLSQRHILREEGSGSREIFEQILKKHSFSIHDLTEIMEVNNISATKQLVKNHVGISFLYQAAVQKELDLKELVPLPLPDYSETREFNFVFLNNSVRRPFFETWFHLFRTLREEN